MNKVGKIIFDIILGVIIICVIAYAVFLVWTINNVKSSSNVNTNENTNQLLAEEENEITEPIFTLETYPRVDASLATQPLSDAFAKAYISKDVDLEKLEYSNTHPAYIKLIDGEKDLIIVTEPSEEELAYAEEKGVELEVTPVVREAFVFYVNNENPVKKLTIEQIQKIYTGEIKNWKEVGGENLPIKPFQRPKNSGSQTGMLSLVMKDKEIMEPLKEDIIESMFGIVDAVANYADAKESIGYSYYYYANTMFKDMDSETVDKISFVKVNGVEPNNQTIKSNEYPIQTAYYIVTRKDEPKDSNVSKLKELMLSKKGQEIAESVGYVGR